ncbi:DUF4166 domain-containing protein [Microbulbifer zhoushanensis]|uniref:DUF4166 domain-containing protein n=1 Tax=Microbulbifer zhoushanensis TaxID=2904254 RepID=UPI001F2C2E0F|nr:DUF4166 domain-containing protein [Microbulbifer zhoushanensis]
MPSTIVKDWFGCQFTDLHPMLQQLHIRGGRLVGEVTLARGSGLAGLVGRRLARKMNLPEPGAHRLAVDISHDADGLHWRRSFNGTNRVDSLFRPVGNIGQGYWIEETGPLSMQLTVDIIDGGWFWRCLGVKFLGVPVPRWLIPDSRAYKVIEAGKYRFHVEFSLPILGSLVSYSGLLTAGHAAP